MKKFLLLPIVCMFLITHVNANSPSKSKLEQKKAESKATIKKENPVVVRDRNYYTETQRKTNDLKVKAEEKKSNHDGLFSTTLQNFSGLAGFTKARNVEEFITKYQLDSVHFTDEYDANVWLVKLTYHWNYLPKRQDNLMWDAFSQSYELWERYDYEWYSNGYIKMESVMTYDDMWGDYGIMYRYSYNAENLCNSFVILYNEGDGWFPTDSMTFSYDERGNPIEVYSYIYSGSWEPAGKELADYDNFNRQTSYEGYYFDGADWIGFAKDEKEWLPSGEYLIILLCDYEWDYDKNSWVYYRKLEQEWNANFQLTLQVFSFWNSEKEDWSGEVGDEPWILYNMKAILTYDAEGKQTYELASELRGGSWFSTFEFEFDWGTHAATGELQVNVNGYLFEFDGVAKTHVDDYWARYCKFFPNPIAVSEGKFTYRTEATNWEGDGWEYIFEEVYEYDNQGRQVKESHWGFWEGEKFADISETLTYDAHSNIIKSVYHIGQFTGADDWVLASTFDYEFDQYNYEIRRYRYAGEELTPDWGYGVDFDYDVPASLVISFPANDGDPFKIFYLYDYVGNGTGFDEQVRTFYYSEKQVNIKEVVNDKKVTIYPNPTTNTITIKTDDERVQVQIYNMLGIKMLQTTDKVINLSSFAPGVYMVNVNGTTTKVVKK